MQPLIRDNATHSTLNKYFSRKYRNSKSLCIISAILLIVIIVSIVYFTSSSSQRLLHGNNGAASHNFIDRPDNNMAYPSQVQWKDPHRKLPPKPGGKMAAKPGQNEQSDTGYKDPSLPSSPSSIAAPPDYSSSNWQSPPPGTDGATVNGITYGGDDVTTIDRPDDFEVPTDGEVVYGEDEGNDNNDNNVDDVDDDGKQQKQEQKQEQKKEQEEEGEHESQSQQHPDPIYPTKVTTVDGDRNIIKSDPLKASEYYKSNGADDLISSMPYLVESTCSASKTQCGFKQYSGYLLGNNNVEIHYWFIEAEEDAMNKPVFFWTNGGPGCSGMDGLLTEHGPWRVTDDLKIHYNPYSWNSEVNMVYLEQPYGVGFSSIEGTDSVVSGDQNAADDMDAVIRNWLIKFPFYSNNKIYLSSESWGGHYVPIASYTILQNNDAGMTPKINFGGFLLGNPYTDFYENAYGFVGDIYGHGLMKSSDWDTWREKCWGNEHSIDNDAVCSAIYSSAYLSAYNANVYALDYPQCSDDMDWDLELLNRPEPSYWIKNAHIHHATKRFMEVILAHHDYDALKMSLEKSELQQLHDRIAQQLELEKDDYYGGAPQRPQQPQQGQQPPPQQPVQGMPQQPVQGGAPQQGGQQQGGQQMPQQPVQGTPPQQGGNQQMPQQQPVQGMPDQSQTVKKQRPKKPKAPSGVEHGRPNHNIGNRANGESQAERDEEEARMEEEKQKEAAAKEAAEEEEDNDANVEEYSDGYLPCIEYDMADYLNLYTVQQALNVKPSHWQMCSDTVYAAWPESDYDTKIQAFYSEIIENYLISNSLELAIYSGDDDSVCGLQGTQYWMDRWKYKVNGDYDWESWQDDNKELGGFYSQYMTDDGNNVALHFITARSAGHMVPTTQPNRALSILKKYLNQFNKE